MFLIVVVVEEGTVGSGGVVWGLVVVVVVEAEEEMMGLDLGVGCFLGTVGSMDVLGCESDGAKLRLRL